MDIDEFAHALGVVFCRPSLGDLDLAPGPMHVNADEQIDGAVAMVLAIVTFQLPWFGRDRLAHLADQLDRALVEADHRPLGIGRCGIEVEHVFHAGNIFAVDPRNAPHILAPGLETVFGQPPAHRLARQALMPGELDHGVGQQFKRPAGATLGRVCASRRHQQGFFLAGELALRPRTRILAQCPFQIAFHEAALGPVHGGTAHRHRTRNLFMLWPASAASKIWARLSLRAARLPLLGGPDELTNESKIRHRSQPQRSSFHRKARPIPGFHLHLLAHVPIGSKSTSHNHCDEVLAQSTTILPIPAIP